MATRTQRDAHLFHKAKIWGSFWRANPHRFAAFYLNLHLKLFQKILLYMMNICYYFCYIAARGQGKSWLIAVFCCVRCILYPGTTICIASGTRGQSITILEKIKMQLLPKAPLLQLEIANIKISATDAYIEFHNGSFIKVVTAKDTARSNRANILITDEFRMVAKDILDTVLRKFLTAPREPGYLHKPKYAHLKERNKEIYLSSAFYQSHWSYKKMRDYASKMLDIKESGGIFDKDASKYFVCGLPYQLSIDSGLLDAHAVADEMAESDFNEVSWSMEMECIWWGNKAGAFFNFDSISANRKLKFSMLPDEYTALLNDSKLYKIPAKQPGEKRLLSIDIALMASTKTQNDASAIFINQLLPTKTNRYINNVVYTESSEGEHTADQALRVRKLYEMYDCDRIIVDVKGVGFGVADALVRDIQDPETGEEYPALSCCNNPEWAKRCKAPGAEKAIYAVNGSPEFNSQCAVLLRDGFRTGKIKLLEDESTGKVFYEQLKAYNQLSEEDKLELRMPYINTTLLVNELINLQSDDSTGKVRVYEKSGFRKDRYSSLSYNYYVACELEGQLRAKRARVQADDSVWMFRAPKIKR